MTAEQLEDRAEGTTPLRVIDINAGPNYDPVLQCLVALANGAKDFGMGVTLHVSGIVVSGTLISYQAYWEALRAFMRSGNSPAGQAETESFADNFADIFGGLGPKVNSEPSEAGEGRIELPSHIHLRDALVWVPGAEPTLPPTLWRGRLSHVSAWSAGAFGRS